MKGAADGGSAGRVMLQDRTAPGHRLGDLPGEVLPGQPGLGQDRGPLGVVQEALGDAEGAHRNVDVGVGLDAGAIGAYLAKGLDNGESVKFVVRLQRRF